MVKTFIVTWCSEGLESVVPVSDIEQEVTMALLKGEQPKENVNHILQMLHLRAIANTQRFYEIYVVSAADGITQEDIEEMFEHCPQTAADTIRQIGVKYYSNRQNPSRIKIT